METEDGKTGEGSQEWDKERQLKDELSAANIREGELRGELKAAKQYAEDAKKQASDDSTEENLDDYDNLKGVVVDLRNRLQASEESGKKLTGQLDQIGATSRSEEGKKLLAIEVTKNEKLHGTKDYTNAVIKEVTDLFTDPSLGLDKMPPAAKSEWIRLKLKEAYRDAADNDTSKKTSSESKDVTTDTGDGGSGRAPTKGRPAKNVPMSSKEVTAFMLEKNRAAAANN